MTRSLIRPLFAAVTAAFLATGCGGTGVSEVIDAGEGTRFSYSLGECQRDGSGALQKPAAFTDSSITVSGTSVTFSHVLTTYCNAVVDSCLQVRPEVDGSTIVINEVFKGPAVRCVCSFPVSGKVEGLAPGEYTLRFVYTVELADGPLESQEAASGSSTVKEATVTVRG